LRGGDWRDWALRILYWAAVLLISLAILVGLIMLLESRDTSEVGSFIQSPFAGARR
jgi:hypothetical protein